MTEVPLKDMVSMGKQGKNGEGSPGCLKSELPSRQPCGYVQGQLLV